MGCSSNTTEELESKLIELKERRKEIIKLKKRKIKRLEKITAQKYQREIIPECYEEPENNKIKKDNQT